MEKIVFRVLFIFVLVIASVLGGCRDDGGSSDSFAVEESFQGDGISVLVRVGSKEISIADTVAVELEVLAAADIEVVFPDVSEGLDDFDIVDEMVEADRLGGDDKIIKLRRYRLEPMVAGKVSLPALRFEYVPKGALEAKAIETKSVEINVVSVLGDSAEETQLAEIEGVVELRDYTTIIWVAAVVVVILIIVVVFVIKSLHKKEYQAERVFRSAHEIALARLKELEDEGLVSSGMLKIFYERVSNVLRYYIEDRFTLKAPERTTEEFLFELKSASVLAVADKDSLGKFLRHCDLVKFAKHEPSDEQVSLTVDLVKDFIDRTKSDESLVEIS